MIWSTNVYFDLYEPPGDAFEIPSWPSSGRGDLQHPEGRSEINENCAFRSGRPSS